MNCLIIEDEILAAERLIRLLSEVAPGIECAVAMNGEDALLQAKIKLPELVFLDVRMPGIDGIQVAARLRNFRIPPAIIFCTAYETHALAAIQQQACAYLLKPVSRGDLSNAIELGCKANRIQFNALRKMGSGHQYIRSVTHRGVQTMAIDLVRCFVADEKYVLVCGGNRDFLISESLKKLEIKFKDKLFRVHRKALVATNYLLGLQRSNHGWTVSLEGTHIQPPVSRRHLTRVRRFLDNR